jgi:D-sedoheptulose 7-phosphate isomerase
LNLDLQQTRLGETAFVFPPELLASVGEQVEESLCTHKAFQRDCLDSLSKISHVVAQRLLRGGKVLIFGNGGSAADAQHIAAELVGRYRRERKAMPALALTVNSSTLSAVANDYGFDEVFARQLAAFATRDDVAIGISTSGNSRNVLKGIRVARELGLITIGFTGCDGGELLEAVDLCLSVPSNSTARIQECHILSGHIISEWCERLFVESASEAERI